MSKIKDYLQGKVNKVERARLAKISVKVVEDNISKVYKPGESVNCTNIGVDSFLYMMVNNFIKNGYDIEQILKEADVGKSPFIILLDKFFEEFDCYAEKQAN